VTSTTLQHLTWFLPDSVKAKIAGETRRPSVGHITEHPVLDDEIMTFILAYRDLAFGWKFAESMAHHRLDFPGVVDGADEVLYRAYLYICNPRRYREDDLVGACALAFGSLKHARNTLEALLVVRGATAASVAEKMQISPEVVLAYEKLFFNILDRKKDAEFVAEIIYPEGRHDENLDKYWDRVNLADVLKRAAFNNGASHVLHFSGYDSNLIQTLAANDPAGALESKIMATGVLLASNGYLNQRTNCTGLNHARQIMAAAKQGGQETVKPSPFNVVGASLFKEMVGVKTIEAEASARFQQSRSRATKVKS